VSLTSAKGGEMSHSTTAGKEGTARLRHREPPWDSQSWWYEDEDYPDEGQVGPFLTKDEALEHAFAVYAVVLETNGKPAAEPVAEVKP